MAIQAVVHRQHLTPGMTMMIMLRAFAPYAVLPLLLLLPACGKTKPAFRQEIPVRRYLPAPADSTWKDQAVVRTPIKVGPDSLPAVVEWTPAHRDAHRAISRIVVSFPEHPASDSLSASLQGQPVNHGTRDAIREGITLVVGWSRSRALSNSIVHLSGDGTATRY